MTAWRTVLVGELVLAGSASEKRKQRERKEEKKRKRRVGSGDTLGKEKGK